MVVAVLLGLLGMLILWGKWRGDGHHEGNPHPDDMPKKVGVVESGDGGGDVDKSEEAGKKKQQGGG